MKTIYIFAEQTTTDGKRFLLGYELGESSPSTGDIEVLDVSEYLEEWRPR